MNAKESLRPVGPAVTSRAITVADDEGTLEARTNRLKQVYWNEMGDYDLKQALLYWRLQLKTFPIERKLI